VRILRTVADFRRARADYGMLGLVPTMGALHAGHLSLVRQADAECDAVAVSIFVNPTQFGPHEDFVRYPRDIERDLHLLRDQRVQLVFVPDLAEMYPPSFATYINVEQLSEPLEGAARPGHFRGVATVVCKLLLISGANRAYFGQKDAQQSVVIRRMVADLNIPTDVRVCPTLREHDGLAMSSRNAYLGSAEREAATVLYRALNAARELYVQGRHDGAAMRAAMRRVLASEPLAEVEYVSAADPQSLRELDVVGEQGVLLSLAVRIGQTRLIDNILLPAGETH
jgi:pantoate--beta-alanine ligase